MNYTQTKEKIEVPRVYCIARSIHNITRAQYSLTFFKPCAINNPVVPICRRQYALS